MTENYIFDSTQQKINMISFIETINSKLQDLYRSYLSKQATSESFDDKSLIASNFYNISSESLSDDSISNNNLFDFCLDGSHIADQTISIEHFSSNIKRYFKDNLNRVVSECSQKNLLENYRPIEGYAPSYNNTYVGSAGKIFMI